jgi:hypothetical protein
MEYWGPVRLSDTLRDGQPHIYASQYQPQISPDSPKKNIPSQLHHYHYHCKMSMFPDPRRIVTGHNESGKSIVVADSTIPCEPTPIKCNFAVLYETHEFPASLDTWEDPILTRTQSLANDKGVVLRVVDFPANTETVSLP